MRHWNNISEASQTVEQHFRNKSMKQHFTGIYISQKLGQPKHWDIYKINLSTSHIWRKHFRTKDKYKWNITQNFRENCIYKRIKYGQFQRNMYLQVKHGHNLRNVYTFETCGQHLRKLIYDIQAKCEQNLRKKTTNIQIKYWQTISTKINVH